MSSAISSLHSSLKIALLIPRFIEGLWFDGIRFWLCRLFRLGFNQFLFRSFDGCARRFLLFDRFWLPLRKSLFQVGVFWPVKPQLTTGISVISREMGTSSAMSQSTGCGYSEKGIGKTCGRPRLETTLNLNLLDLKTRQSHAGYRLNG